jgi:4-amino-4-deoxy-L-arabinose transferase-like glycosyltransferase
VDYSSSERAAIHGETSSVVLVDCGFFAVFGESEWVARLVPVFSGIGCVGLILWFTKSIGREYAGRLAAIVFISSLGVTAMSRILMFDMLLTVLLTAAVMSGYLFCVRKQRKLLYVCMAMLALALLAKGFVALILFFAVMGTYLALSSLTLKNFLSRLYECLHWKGLLFFPHCDSVAYRSNAG